MLETINNMLIASIPEIVVMFILLLCYIIYTFIIFNIKMVKLNNIINKNSIRYSTVYYKTNIKDITGFMLQKIKHNKKDILEIWTLSDIDFRTKAKSIWYNEYIGYGMRVIYYIDVLTINNAGADITVYIPNYVNIKSDKLLPLDMQKQKFTFEQLVNDISIGNNNMKICLSKVNMDMKLYARLISNSDDCYITIESKTPNMHKLLEAMHIYIKTDFNEMLMLNGDYL